MSLLLNQPSKLWFRKPLLVRSSFNDLSSSLTQTPPPCHTIYVEPRQLHIGKFKSPNEITPIEFTNDDIGSSNGWLSTLKDNLGVQDNEMQSICNSQPLLVTLPHCQTKIITNVAYSSSSHDEDDCVMAVKCLGPQLSFCKPSLNKSAVWFNVRIEHSCFFSSRVMFSKKDDMFHVLGSGGDLIASWDPRKKHHIPKFQKLKFCKIPKVSIANREVLDSCCKSVNLVESRTSSETFLVRQYKKIDKIVNGIARMKTEAVMVFKLDEEGNAIYTKDIGDQSLFITEYETFCVPTSFFDNVLPNQVKIFDVDETIVVNLADKKWSR